MIIPTRYEFIKRLLEELGPGEEKKTKEFIEFVQKTRNNFVYIRNGFFIICSVEKISDIIPVRTG